MYKKIAGVSAVLMIAIGIGLVVFWPFGSGNVMRLPGIVEVQEVRLGSKVGGRVAEVLVKEGVKVSPGQPLVIFEAPELENQKKQLLARLDAVRAEWKRMVNGARPEEKEAALALADAARARSDKMQHGWRIEEKLQAKSEWESADADFEQATKDWTRVQQLYRQQSVSRLEYEAALAYRDLARGRVEAARQRKLMLENGSRDEDKDEMLAEARRAQAKYDELKNGNRSEDIAAAAAKVAELEAKIEELEISLKETTVAVPPRFGKAVVEVLSIRPGDLVPPNQPVVRVLRIEDLWVKIFVPETKYGLVTLDKEVEVTIDSHPGKRLKGIVAQRANISEFTPRNVQSVDERRHQVFGVKIRVDDPQGVLNAGMAAEVAIPLD